MGGYPLLYAQTGQVFMGYRPGHGGPQVALRKACGMEAVEMSMLSSVVEERTRLLPTCIACGVHTYRFRPRSLSNTRRFAICHTLGGDGKEGNGRGIELTRLDINSATGLLHLIEEV